MRFFIAMEIPSQNIPQFQSIQHSLSKLIPHLKITSLDKIHLTLAFLGEQPDELHEKLIQIIKVVTSGVATFEVTPAYIDGFPNIHHPNVLRICIFRKILLMA